jgi:hypothetical protein
LLVKLAHRLHTLAVDAQAISSLANERTGSIYASSKEAAQQLAGAVQQLQGSQQSILAAAECSNNADTALAKQLAGAAGTISEETTGEAQHRVADQLPSSHMSEPMQLH